MPQLVRRVAFDGRRALLGIELLAYGVVKKTVFADNLAVYVDAVYADPAAAGGLDVVLATLAWQAATIRGMMSATGLLYIAVAAVLAGEVLARGLLFATGAAV